MRYEFSNFESGNLTLLNFNKRLSSSYLDEDFSLDILDYPIVHTPVFILRSSLVLTNPYPYSFNEYLNYYPEDLNFPTYTITLPAPNAGCVSKQLVHLPLTSSQYDIDCSMLINACADYDDFATVVDHHLSGYDDIVRHPFKDSPYIQPYVEELKTGMARNLTPVRLIEDIDYSPHLFYSTLHHKWNGQTLWAEDYKTPQSLSCDCTLEATSLIEACKGFGYGIYQLLMPDQMSTIESFIERWAVELLDLTINFSISKLFFSFLKLIQEFVSLSELIKRACILMKDLSLASVGKVFTASKQQHTEDVQLEATSLLSHELVDLKQYTDSAPVVASAMATIGVLFASAIVGFNVVTVSSQKCATEKLADAMNCISKGKNGIYALKAIISDFSTFIHNTVFELLVGSGDDIMTKLIFSSNVTETNDLKKVDFFKYLTFINNPSNTILIQQNSAYQQQMEFCFKILSDISYKLANQDIHVSMATRDYIKLQLLDLSKLRANILRKPKVEAIRFKPFWVNIIGDSQLGKSIFTSYLTNVLYDILERKGTYNVPAKENFLYPVNFTEKYITHYTGQYVVAIDDFLQDSAPLGERSSALDMITWVSSIPHYTNQAGVLDKGIPFDSKIIISSSNDNGMQRNEIISSKALKERQAMRVLFVYDECYEPDPLLGGKRVRIFRQDKISGQRCGFYKNAREFIIDFVRKYDLHYKQQYDIMEKSKPSKEEIEKIYEEIFLEGTSSFKCKLGMSPNIKFISCTIENQGTMDIDQFDCDCDMHVQINSAYEKYIQLFTGGPLCHDIKQFSKSKFDLSIYQNKFNSTIDWVKIKLLNLLKTPVGKTIALAIAGIGIYYLGSAALANKPAKEDEEVEDLDLEPTKAQYNISKPVRPAPRPALIATSKIDEIEPILSSSVSKQSYDLIFNNIVKRGAVCLLTATKNKQINTGLRIGGRAILTNHHFFSFMQKGDEFVVNIRDLTKTDQLQKQQYDPIHCHRIGQSDLVVYLCDGSMPMARNILKHFPDEQVVSSFQDAIVVAAYPQPLISMNVVATPNVHVSSSYTLNDIKYDVIDSYVTNCPVEKGMSGSVLVGTNSKLSNKILGIQVCRNQKTGHGYFKPVSRQQLLLAFDELNVTEFMSQEEELLEGTSVILDNRCPPNLANSSMRYIGSLPKGKFLKPQNKSKIMPSLIHDETQRTQEPSVLHNLDERMNDEVYGKDVLFRAMEGFDKPIGSVNRQALRQAVTDLKVEYDVVLDSIHIPRRLLTEDEMINGVPQVINRVEMKSSPGYPYVLQRKLTTVGGKYEWFDEVAPPTGYGKFYKMKDSLKCGLEQREQLMLKGIKPPVIAYACLKDETRPLKKIQDGKTRAFLCLPLDYNLLIRKYFGAFIASLHQKAGIVTSCVGIDPATQWKDLFDKLMSKNNEWEDFDYQNWDQHLHPEFVLSVASLVNYWYKDSDDSPIGKLRIMLLHDLIFTTIIVKDRLFQKSTGQCSGCAITAELNCIVHDILMYYVWLIICKEKNQETDLAHYRDIVASIMYGDDIVKSVREEYVNMFNGDAIKPHMEMLGMGITPGDKESVTFEQKDPSKILFLKRSFIKDGHFVKAPLRLDIVENIPQWIHKSDDSIEATRVNCETALRESYMHGESYFYKLRDNINERIKNYNRINNQSMPPIVLNYDSLDMSYQGHTFICSGLSGPVQVDGLW